MKLTDMKVAKLCAERISALAEPHRIRIVDSLRSGPKNVTELSQLLKIPIVNVSHHLGVLRNAGLVEDNKEGRFMFYTLHPDLFKTAKGTTSLDLNWCVLEFANAK